jgi:pentatricopeptide repeat protein
MKIFFVGIALSLSKECRSFTVQTRKAAGFSASERSSSRTNGVSSLTIQTQKNNPTRSSLQSPIMPRYASATATQENDDLSPSSSSKSTHLADALSDILGEEEFREHEPTSAITKATNTATKNQKPKQPPKRTKAQIKKLKFLMMNDVEELIEQKNITAIAKAQDNLDRLQTLYATEGNTDYKPKSINYNLLVRAYGKLGTPEQAERVLRQMDALYKDSQDKDVRPTVITYTEVIDAYGKSSRRDSAEKAEELLFAMMQEAELEDGSMDQEVAPTAITCDAVLNAWARRGTVEAARRAEQILERMEYLRTSGNVNIQPTAYSFATVISAWAKAKFGREETGKENAERAQYILNRMNDYRRQIEKIEAKEQGSGDSHSYAKELDPDVVVYNSVIDAWARSKDPIAGTRAEALLFEMEELYRLGGNIAPDTITYNSVINCHATSGHMNGAKAAERILVKMEKAAKANQDGVVKPNTITYNQVLKAYSKSSLPGRAMRADMILMHMLQSGNKSIRPDVISFSTCLDVWAKSKEPGKAEKAYNILQKMINFHASTGIEKMKPNSITYNTVLNACAFSAFTADKEKKKALSIAIALFNEMQSSELVTPDAITYGMLIKCIANLVPKGDVRNKMASDLFVKCKDSGLVNGLVFDEIRRAVPGNVLVKLLGDAIRQKHKKPFANWELKDLPRAWTKNVVEAKPKGKRRQKEDIPVKKEVAKKEVATFDGDPIKPMRRIIETSWQSGRDV